MGLDCYLSGSRYISEYSAAHEKMDKAINNDVVKTLLPNGVRIERIKVEAAYWRSASSFFILQKLFIILKSACFSR